MKKISCFRPIGFFTLLLFLVSCDRNNKLSEKGEMLEKIILTEEGHFRGITIGDKIDKVKNVEKAALADEDKDYLYYDINLNENDFYNIAYSFDESGLYEIMVDVNFDNKAEVEELFNSFDKYFTDKYGEGFMEENFTIWKTSSDVSKQIEIAMTNNIEDSGEGYLSIAISNYSY